MDILGAWIAVFLTLAIFSFLYKDNAFYKIAEHLFVGVSAGYWMSFNFWTQIQPNLLGRLWPSIRYSEDSWWYSLYDTFSFFAGSIFPAGGIDKGHDMHLIYLFPLLLGMMIMVGVLSHTGVFEYFAVEAYKRSGGNVWTLVVTLCIITAILSAFLDNVTTRTLFNTLTTAYVKARWNWQWRTVLTVEARTRTYVITLSLRQMRTHSSTLKWPNRLRTNC